MEKLQIFKILNKLIEKAKGKPIVLEAGHFYAKDGINNESLAGAYAGAGIASLMENFFEEIPYKMLFIDDVEVNLEETLLAQTWLGVLNEVGFNPQDIVYESTLINAGLSAIRDLRNRELTYSLNEIRRQRQNKLDRKGTIIISEDPKRRTESSNDLLLKHGNIPLTGKAGNPSLPACEVLDAILYRQKLSQFGGAVTVLPVKYQKQQNNTKTILETFLNSHKPNIVVVYHNSRGEVTETNYWGQDE